MTDLLLIANLALLAIVIVLQFVSLGRSKPTDLAPLNQAFDNIEKSLQRVETAVRDEIAKNRGESSLAALQSRNELGATLEGFNDQLVASINNLGNLQKDRIDLFAQQLDKLTQASDQKLAAMRETLDQKLTHIQEDSGKKLDTQRTAIDDRLRQIQTETATHAKTQRDEVGASLKSMSESQQRQMESFGRKLGELIESNQQKLDLLKGAVEEKLNNIQQDNTRQLDQMRAMVDEKLQATLDKRLGESFKQVSERLEAVARGLGEMQVLATGVGDLKKVLTNVKTRGTWGEIQLGALLEEVLTPEQFERNVDTRDSGERVEFAIKLPGRGDDAAQNVWLPIDAKFPMESYQRLVEAQEKLDPEAAEQASRELEAHIKACAKDICDKYIAPPKTTDFGILFLPTEGLFAEVTRRSGLSDFVQRNCRVVITGPTTLWALLNSLQMGFRTLAVQKRSSEVWELLRAVKTEFNKYGEVLAKVQKKLNEASDTISRDVSVRTRKIQRTLSGVEEFNPTDAQKALPFDLTDAALLDELPTDQSST